MATTVDFRNKYIEELMNDREVARLNKDWQLSDSIRNYLDTKLAFIFDTKDGQEIHHLTDDFFDRIYTYKEINNEWSETKMQKIERLHQIKFESKRKFVEWTIESDARAEKNLNSWLYSVNCSINKAL